MARLWAKTVSFASIRVGDQLPILVKSETREMAGPPVAEAAATPRPGLVAYVTELLEKAFPPAAISARGSRLEVQAIHPVGEGDTISLSGQVVGKREEGDLRLVECQILVENQAGQAVARALAVVPL